MQFPGSLPIPMYFKELTGGGGGDGFCFYVAEQQVSLYIKNAERLAAYLDNKVLFWQSPFTSRGSC